MATTRRRKAGSRKGRQGPPAWMWLLTGVLIGLGLSWYLFSKGYIPQPGPEEAVATQAKTTDSTKDSDEVAPVQEGDKKSQYDFFTVLPEMEVYVPEQELSKKSRNQPKTPAEPGDTGSYVLQVGSFRTKADAEQLKARLALLGIVARIQTVTVNDATWHRVRVGPVSGARKAEDMRRRLTDNRIDSLVLKNQ